MKNKTLQNKKQNTQSGFVLLFSVLVSTLVLAVGISIISIAVKQVQLSGAGRDSQYAFYAANTGAECATYWDLADDSTGKNVFSRSDDPLDDLAFDIAEVKCLNRQLAEDDDDRNSGCASNDIYSDTGWCVENDDTNNIYKTKFRIQYTDNKPYCADVIVVKETLNGAVATTTVISRGYNTCEDNPRRIERGLEFHY